MPSVARIEGNHRAAAVGVLGAGRIVIRLIALALLLLALLPLHYVTLWAGRASHWPSKFLAGAAWIVGADVRLVGSPAQRDIFFIGNHTSAIDILAMGGATGTAFIGKAELANTAVVGWLANLNRTLYVSRQDKLGIGDQIKRLRDAMSECHRITVFPEGTTGDGVTLLPFKSSLLAVLEPPPPGLLVQPVWLDYGAATSQIAWVGAETGIRYALRIFARRERFTLAIHFLTPFDPSIVGGRKGIAAEAQRQIAAAMAADRAAGL